MAVLQQSIAVFPPPKTITFLPTDLVCSKAMLVNQSIPIWTLESASSLPSILMSRPLGAPVPTKMASKSLSSIDFMLVISELNSVFIPRLSTWSTSSFRTSSGNLKEGMLVLIRPPA